MAADVEDDEDEVTTDMKKIVKKELKQIFNMAVLAFPQNMILVKRYFYRNK